MRLIKLKNWYKNVKDKFNHLDRCQIEELFMMIDKLILENNELRKNERL